MSRHQGCIGCMKINNQLSRVRSLIECFLLITRQTCRWVFDENQRQGLAADNWSAAKTKAWRSATEYTTADACSWCLPHRCCRLVIKNERCLYVYCGAILYFSSHITVDWPLCLAWRPRNRDQCYRLHVPHRGHCSSLRGRFCVTEKQVSAH